MSVAASRYAKALIDVLYPQKAQAGLEQLQRFSAVLTQQADVRRVFENPTISTERRKTFLKDIADGFGFDAAVRNFLNLLIERNRVDLVGEITNLYQRRLDEKMGIVRARVTSAQALGPDEQREVAAKLQSATGKVVRMELSTDPSLIGGVVAEVGSTIYDGSIRQRLQTFKKSLTTD
jgi:F-type H+-transporting ATPase subunit delta